MKKMITFLIAFLLLTSARAEWEYADRKNEMTDRVSRYALLKSSNGVIQTKTGMPIFATIALRAIEKQPLKFVVYSLQDDLEVCVKTCFINTRFDNEGSRTVQGQNYGKNYSAGFTADKLMASEKIWVDEFLEKIKSTKQLKLELMLYSNGATIFSFDISDLDLNKLQPK